ncbi:putative Arginase [Cardiosporidium cionae]|uniref:Arginase n=1 Tax=Cardiosporidium cionae TaxID=476202 RepID=A0ABQ7J4P0_9APIC|nr:putative Arginase [Cardiosporidium cionae]|eukprot:KAF8817746.1 putative Arginase [Cardiosporidium cionae]
MYATSYTTFHAIQTMTETSMPKHFTTCAVVGAPSLRGQNYLDGVQLAPEYLRKAGLHKVIDYVGKVAHDCGDLNFEDVEENWNASLESSLYHKNVKHSKTLGGSCRKLFEKVYEQACENRLVLTIGGDHSIATGSISGALLRYPELVVVWVDAHADINTPETSPSGNYHGMPMGHLLRLFRLKVPGFEWMDNLPKLQPNSIVYIGLRDLDVGEKKILKELGISCFTMSDIEKLGIGKTVAAALRSVDPYGIRPIHMSFDIDSCDPSIAPGTGTKVQGGLTYREAHFICESIAETCRLVTMDFVEVNPTVDCNDSDLCRPRVPTDLCASKTVRLCLELIGSSLGMKLL